MNLTQVHRHDTGLDRHLAVYDVRSAHSVEVDAAPQETYRAARELDVGKSPAVLAVIAIRALPHVLTGKARPSRSITLTTLLESGFVILEERQPEELVLGAVGKFWRPDSGFVRISPEEFRDFDEPGYAKAAMAFTVDEQGGGSLLATETRVACTDEWARRMFSVYWRLIGPFSGWIRGVMLGQIKRSAEGARP